VEAGREIAGNSERFIFSLKLSARTLLLLSSSEMAAGALLAGLKRTVREADHSPATTVEVQSDTSSAITLTRGRGRTVPSDSTPHMATRSLARRLLPADSEELLHRVYVNERRTSCFRYLLCGFKLVDVRFVYVE
jgi:hypothetical protein